MIARKGFTLIEVIVVLALVSVLIMALFSSFIAGNRISVAVEEEIDMYDTVILIDRQFTRDIAGAFIPMQAIEQQKKNPQAQPPAPEPTKKKLLKDPFLANTQDEGNVRMLTLISNNPMRVYWSESAGKPIPSVVRVYYTLSADKNAPKEKPRFILYRQEGTNLDTAAYTGNNSSIEVYPLAENIKSCRLEFIVEQEEEPAQGQKKEKAKKEIKIFKEWVTTDAEDVRSKVKLPTRVVMQLEIWDSAQEKTREFSLVYPVSAPFSEPKESSPQAARPTPPAPPGAPSTPARAGAAPPKTVAQQEKNKQLIEGAQSIIDGLKAMFGGPAPMS